MAEWCFSHCPRFLQQLADAKDRCLIERLFIINVVGFDWKCPAHITLRYTAAEIEEISAPLKQRFAEFEAVPLCCPRR